MAGRRGVLTGSTSSTHGAVQSLGTIEEAGNHIVIALDITDTKTATVELYARITSGMDWALFDTISLTDENYIQSYDGVALLGWKVTAISGSTTVQIAASYDD